MTQAGLPPPQKMKRRPDSEDDCGGGATAQHAQRAQHVAFAFAKRACASSSSSLGGAPLQVQQRHPPTAPSWAPAPTVLPHGQRERAQVLLRQQQRHQQQQFEVQRRHVLAQQQLLAQQEQQRLPALPRQQQQQQLLAQQQGEQQNMLVQQAQAGVPRPPPPAPHDEAVALARCLGSFDAEANDTEGFAAVAAAAAGSSAPTPLGRIDWQRPEVDGVFAEPDYSGMLL